ncbi:MAG: tryptophan synthase subunit alpha [Gammaproteobacteria bacterium]|nr:tryptophan synthase subunit alpha [Gammaproteobacteria bacterium]
MSRIASRFESLKSSGRKALVPFITAGDPSPEAAVPVMHALVRGGADILEVGVPFSDPMAEGPVIQHASERALTHNVSLRDVLAMVQQFRHEDQETPVILMGYLNPVEVMGYAKFAQAAAAAGVDGVLTVDLPPEEAEDFTRELALKHIDPIFLLAPTSTAERMRRVAAAARGFIYYVSLRGVTGASNMNTAEVHDKLEQIRQFTKLPLGVGFGIKDPETAAAVAGVADAIVVGSALVARLARVNGGVDKIAEEAEQFMAVLRTAIDEVGVSA